MVSRQLFLLAFVALCTVGFVFADGILIQSPSGDTLDPSRERFSFAVDSYDPMAECRLLIDGSVSKRAAYDGVIKGRSLGFAADYEDGTYVWRVECETVEGTLLTTEDRTVEIARPSSVVKVTPSGSVRGSMLHSFTVSSSPDQAPIEIPKIAAGDYLGITLQVYPSKLTKELYVKSRLAEEGVAKLWLTYKQENYYVKEGENVTIPVSGSASVILHFDRIELNRAVLIAYPTAVAADDDEDEVTPQEPVEEPETPVTQPQEPADDSEVSVPEDATSASAEPQERPGAFRRFVSWLVRLFGA